MQKSIFCPKYEVLENCTGPKASQGAQHKVIRGTYQDLNTTPQPIQNCGKLKISLIGVWIAKLHSACSGGQ